MHTLETVALNGHTPGSGRIAVCSPDQLRRDALAAYLATLPEFSVVGRVPDASGLDELARLAQPDIGIVDVGTQPADQLTRVRSLRERFPGMRLVVMYGRLAASELSGLRECGVAAAVPYHRGLGGLLTVLRALPAGADPGPAHGLTGRQREILLLLSSGHQVQEIAQMLQISAGTVENHKRRIYLKLQAAGAVHAVAKAVRLGIIDCTPPSRPGAPNDQWAGRPGRPILTVVAGRPGPATELVQAMLIGHGLPVVWESPQARLPQIHWLRSHRGPVMRVLVNPGPEHWRIGATLGWSAILVHDDSLDSALMQHAVSHGVVAVVPAHDVERRLLPVLDLAVSGYVAMDPGSGALFLDSLWARAAGQNTSAPDLTGREYDILRSIGRSHTVRQTARALGIATKTVENAQSALFRKLGVHNRAAALAAAYTLGLLQP